MKKLKRTLQSSPKFILKLKQIQGEIKAKNGKEPSLTDLTNEIMSVPAFKEVEEQIINGENKFRIKFD